MGSSLQPGEGGGFLNPTLPSPAPSTATASTTTPSHLPRQRMHPLKPGGAKESSLINYVDGKILRINRRHAKKFSSVIDDQGEDGDKEKDNDEEQSKGYESFKEVVEDVEDVIDVVWVSGTPSIQIPYLISLAGLVNTYFPDYPFQPKPTFRILRKLDIIFASLLVGEDVESGIPLSGFEYTKSIVSVTEKVRIKSIAEASRIAVVEKRVKDDESHGGEDESENEDDWEDGMDIDGNGDESGRTGLWEMEAARVYERTIQYLGDELGKGGELVV
ncbi:conserved hypothetical protein [Talaromyces stipitatus ATCC 10500]|uniref:Uncharacterized protein n=1 Tax=Talaromyces stipitatus (strain ATCC 10500 / CBS 375.48 / QM 6759 / NRRL 1006) TaxID=441959 RepID=B8MTZ3_TALSN|nr:uncharacterized protein TSTA_006480 [Talaromyces stipitatus ATCC 10500]EED12626.1 conserved hypothetical protein [Talaromyces stipitatus ATCC 10500]